VCFVFGCVAGVVVAYRHGTRVAFAWERGVPYSRAHPDLFLIDPRAAHAPVIVSSGSAASSGTTWGCL
jgi:hypothetical protein